MDIRIASVADILRLNTNLFRNCLEGLNDEQANQRPSESSNSMAFIAGHLADARFYLLRQLGGDHANPLASYLSEARRIEDLKQPIPLSEIHGAWTTASHALRDRMESLSSEELDAPLKSQFPIANQTVLGMLAFLTQHDTYHLGQLAFLRKMAGLPAMRYI